MIEINEKTIGIWAVHLGSRGDWLGHLARGAKGIELKYRFRWYRDDKLYEESKDKKNWYRVESRAMSEAQGIEVVRGAYQEILTASVRNKGWELLRGERSVEEFMAELFAMPGMNHKMLDAEGNEIPEGNT